MEDWKHMVIAVVMTRTCESIMFVRMFYVFHWRLPKQQQKTVKMIFVFFVVESRNIQTAHVKIEKDTKDECGGKLRNSEGEFRSKVFWKLFCTPREQHECCPEVVWIKFMLCAFLGWYNWIELCNLGRNVGDLIFRITKQINLLFFFLSISCEILLT